MRYLSCLVVLTVGLGIVIPALALAQELPETVGFTQYDLQSTGSVGRRIAVDSAGSIHFVWMCGEPFPYTRNVRYNYLGPNGFLWPDIGTIVSRRNQDGYCQLDISSGNPLAIINHNASPAGAESLYCNFVQDPIGGESWRGFPPNTAGGLHFMWPYITADRSNRIHIVTTAVTVDNRDFVPFAYTRSNDAGTTWTALEIVDTVAAISPIIVSSKVSDKVAIVYTHPADSMDLHNDIYYVESTDGISWNGYLPKYNITDYGHQGGWLWAWAEVSALYDYNDNLHIIWNAQYISYTPQPHYVVADAHLYHYDVSSGSIHAFGDFYQVWPDSGCDFGQWNFAFAKFSIAADRANNLYVTYTSWNSGDCSQGGYANGDIFLQYSTDNGAAWSNPINLTNSQTPDCLPGDCESDHWSSLAEVADTAIHLFYVNDRDAGSIPNFEGTVTDNPMIYLPYSDGLPLTGIEDDINKPQAFSLSQNYPNPFNARTTIKYSLKKKSSISLSIYNITGQKVATLNEGNQEAGDHQIVWNAEDVSSGIYFARLESEDKSQSIRMTLLK
jgi:hypothetical protein